MAKSQSKKRKAAGFLDKKSKGLVPHRGTSLNLVIVGFIFGAVIDAGYLLYKGPFYDKPSPFGPKIFWGDLAQLGLYGFLTFIGITNGRGDLTSFGFGLGSGKLTTSIVMPSQNLPRYGLFDIVDGKLVAQFGTP